MAVVLANDATVLIVVAVVVKLADREILTRISGFLLRIFLPSTKTTRTNSAMGSFPNHRDSRLGKSHVGCRHHNEKNDAT